MISVIPDWVQAGAAVVIVSASQTERSQMPFLTVAWWEGPPNSGAGGWEIQNQGVGPALNVRFTFSIPLRLTLGDQ